MQRSRANSGARAFGCAAGASTPLREVRQTCPEQVL